MKPIWRQKWQNLARKRAQSGLYARSSAVTLRGKAILPSFGFGRFGHLHRRERLENESHFLRFRSSQLVKTIQTKLSSFMGPYPMPALQANRNAALGQKNPASGGMKPAIGCVVALARCAGIALRTTPDRVDRFDAMKWVSIYDGWYYCAAA
nr:hypothetical protein [uncultured Roseibium sp.]